MTDTCVQLVGVITSNGDTFQLAWIQVTALPTTLALTILDWLTLILNLDVVGSPDVIDVGRVRCSAPTLTAWGGS